MNRTQFEIVKSMQKMGIKYTSFAKACHIKASLMARAYNAANYEVFTNPSSKDEFMERMSDLFGDIDV